MVSIQDIQNQLQRIGVAIRFWGRAEMQELRHILVPGEQIKGCLNGHYEGGFAMLCITDQRILLVDKKPMYLLVEDIRYDMIVEVDFGYRLLDASTTLCTPNKTLTFRAFKQKELREATTYIQRRVMELRQQNMAQVVQQPQEVRGELANSFSQVVPRTTAVELGVPGTMRGVGSMNPYTSTPLRTNHRVSRFGKFLIR